MVDNGNRRPVIASGRRYRIDDERKVRAVFGRRQDWQKVAWEFYDLVGELKYGVNLLGNSLSRLRLYVGTHSDDPAQPPEETTNPVAVEALARLGAHSDILHDLGIHLSVVGECYLVGIMARLDEQGRVTVPEMWKICSTDEITNRYSKVTVMAGKFSDDAIELTTEDFWARIWQPHPRKGDEADSSVRGILSACDTLVTLDQAVRAVTRSRMWSGSIVCIPNDFSFGSTDPASDSAGDGEGTDDPFMQDFMDAITTPIQDPGSASAVTPITLRYPRRPDGQASGIEVHRIDRPMDEMLEKLTDRAQRRLGQGINLPVEIISGLGQANHWGGGQIEEGMFRDHLEPLAITAVMGLTDAYLRPELTERGVPNPESYVVWFDASNFVVRSDRQTAADFGVQNALIRPQTWRGVKGFNEDDAPTDDERDEMIATQQALHRGRSDPLPESEDPSLEPAPEPEAVAAAAPRVRSRGRALTDIDRDLRLRVWEACESALRRTLEKTEARLVSRSGKDKDLAAIIRASAPGTVAATLGASNVARLGVDAPEMISGSFDELIRRVGKWAGAAWVMAADVLEVKAESRRGDMTQATENACEWLRQTMESLAAAILFDPTPRVAEGEDDPDARVPARVAREFVSRAGGGGPHDTPNRIAAAGIEAILALTVGDQANWIARGIGSSLLLMDAAKQERGIVQSGWVWSYGVFPRGAPFPPHMDLEGEFFTNFDDSILRSPGFPSTEFMYPGDHRGCMCDCSPALSDDTGVSLEGPDVQASLPQFDAEGLLISAEQDL